MTEAMAKTMLVEMMMVSVEMGNGDNGGDRLL